MKRPYKPYLCFCSKCERNDKKVNLDISKILTTKMQNLFEEKTTITL